jgi:hypothetical protein
MSFWIKLAVGLAAAYGAIGFAGFLGQRKLMYFPDRHRTLPADVGLADVEERTIGTAGRVRGSRRCSTFTATAGASPCGRRASRASWRKAGAST